MFFSQDHLGFNVLKEFTQMIDYDAHLSFSGGGALEHHNALSVSNYAMRTTAIFPNGLPDQYTVIAVFDTNPELKSWVRGFK